jgi:hypothetical protein
MNSRHNRVDRGDRDRGPVPAASGFGRRDVYLGVQRAVYRAASGHVHEPGALLAGEVTIEVDLSSGLSAAGRYRAAQAAMTGA